MATFHFGSVVIQPGGNIDLGGSVLTNSGTTANNTDVATKTYVDSIVQTQETRIDTALSQTASLTAMVEQLMSGDDTANSQLATQLSTEIARAIAAEAGLASRVCFNAIATLSSLAVTTLQPLEMPETFKISNIAVTEDLSVVPNGWYFRGNAQSTAPLVIPFSPIFATPTSQFVVFFNCVFTQPQSVVPKLRISNFSEDGHCTEYSVDTSNGLSLLPGIGYSFYVSSPDNQAAFPNTNVPFYTPINLKTKILLTQATHACSNSLPRFEVYAEDTSFLSIIITQVGIVSPNGTQNILMDNDSVRAAETRRRLDQLYRYFFRASSEIPLDAAA